MSYQMIGGDTNNLDTVVGQINQNIAQLKVDEQTKIVKDDTGTRRVLLGKGADGFYGLKVSKGSYDVYSTDDENLIFNSNNNLFKIIDSGTVSIPSGTTPSASVEDYSVDVSHSLGFAPLVIAYTVESNDSLRLFGVLNIDSSTLTGGFVETQVMTDEEIFSTDTYVRFYVAHTNATGSGVDFLGRTIKYYILQETAN